jgi:hypothetical protein
MDNNMAAINNYNFSVSELIEQVIEKSWSYTGNKQ